MRTCYPRHLLTLAILFATLALATTTQAQTVRFVDASASGANDGTSWSDAYVHLQDALDEANLNDSTAFDIRVAEGVYYPDDDEVETIPDQFVDDGAETGDHVADDSSEVFVISRDSVTLMGGYPAGGGERDVRAHVTILSGDITQDDAATTQGVTERSAGQAGNNSNSVLSLGTNVDNVAGAAERLTGATRIDGLTITAGQSGSNGGGIFNAVSSPTLVDVVFAGNRAAQFGGGLYNEGSVVSGPASPTLLNVVFSGNEAGNGGGGMYNLADLGVSSPVVVNTVFVGNTVTEGGGGAVENFAFQEGSESSPTFVNASFVGNSAADQTFGEGGAVRNLATSADAEPLFVNCIFWGNSAASRGGEIFNVDAASPTVAHSIVEGGVDGSKVAGTGDAAVTDGGGNLSDHPLFADADGADDVLGTLDDDLALQNGSPAIDAGDNGALPPDSLDVDGDGDTTETLPLDRARTPRVEVVDGGEAVVDLGAYEHEGGEVPVAGRQTPPAAFRLYGNAPNPVAGKTTIRYALPQPASVILELYDVLGRKVATLVDEQQTAGHKQISLDAAELSAGVYVYRLQAGDYVETRRMVLVR